MTLSDRLDNLFDGAQALLDAGLSIERVRDVVGPEGLDLDRLTDDELQAVVDAGGEYVGETGVRWEDATDDELERIAAGEDPGRVFRGR